MEMYYFFKIVGALFFFVGLGALGNFDYYKKVWLNISKDGLVLYMLGMFNIVLGCLLVSVFDSWDAPDAMLAALLSWMVLLKGIVTVLFPKVQAGIVKSFTKNAAYLKTSIFFIIILGTLFIYLGYIGL